MYFLNFPASTSAPLVFFNCYCPSRNTREKMIKCFLFEKYGIFSKYKRERGHERKTPHQYEITCITKLN